VSVPARPSCTATACHFASLLLSQTQHNAVTALASRCHRIGFKLSPHWLQKVPSHWLQKVRSSLLSSEDICQCHDAPSFCGTLAQGHHAQAAAP